MKPLVIFGIGDQAELAQYLFEKDSSRKVAAFTVDREFVNAPAFHSLPIVPFEEVESQFPPEKYDLFVAVGYSRVNMVRMEKYLAAKEKGYQLASYISSNATIFENVKLGDNCFIFEDNTLQPFVTIGNNVTMWSGNHVGHHSEIGDHCFIASHAVISGRVKVEQRCFIGVNATIRDHLIISRECVIGAGSLILKNTKEKEVYIADKTRPSKYTTDNLPGI